MFGFISNFKKDVVAGFDAVHQRLVTLEAQVAALFEHTKQVATQDVATAKADAAEVQTTTEAVTNVAEDVAKVEADAKQV